MSNYMNYAEASKLYDEARLAADADSIYNIFTGLLKKKPEEVYIKIIDGLIILTNLTNFIN